MQARKAWSALMLVLVLFTCPAWAKVTGVCSNCHTMHNSQGGISVTGGTPMKALLNNTCYGCHQGANTSTTITNTPYVFDPNGPNYGVTGTEADTDTLAGGNFYWVAFGNDRAGHNVDGIANQDLTLGNTPPGGTALSARLTCAGTNGCHGDRAISDQYIAVAGGHHGHVAGQWQDGSTVSKSFRFLLGVEGLEDSQYEFQPSQTQHNKYYGVDRTSEADSPGTISSLCAQCHGDFHNGTGEIASGTFGAGVWIRHPTDFDMGRAASSSEYLQYNGGTGTSNPYSVIVPVGTTDTSTNLNTTVTVSSAVGQAIVMCISCHRAHGTPYDAILRWNYKKWPGVDGYNGCAVCHTAKD